LLRLLLVSITLFSLMVGSHLLAQDIQAPATLIGPDSALKLIFKDFKIYFYQLEQKSVVSYLNNSCRIYRYTPSRHGSGSREKVDFKFCIVRNLNGQRLDETLVFKVNGRPAGEIKVSREGDTTPTPDQQLFSLLFPAPSKFINFSLEVPLVNHRFSYSRIVGGSTTRIKVNDQTLVMIDQKSPGELTRSYQSSCSDCSENMDLLAKVEQVGDLVSINYYLPGMLSNRIDPHLFNELLAMWPIHLTTQGQTLHMSLVMLGWPEF
jgi:hypothetical protein